MISEHSAHLTPLSVDFRTWLWRYTYLLLLISMLWHRQAIFKSKGDKLCSSAECRIWTRHQIAKTLNSTSRPYDQRAFSPLDPTVSWLLHLALAIYIFVVINFDALAQASDIQIKRRQVVFLCWMQDLNPGSQTPGCVKIMPLTRSVECEWINKSPLPTNVSDTVNAPPPYTLDIDDSGGTIHVVWAMLPSVL